MNKYPKKISFSNNLIIGSTNKFGYPPGLLPKSILKKTKKIFSELDNYRYNYQSAFNCAEIVLNDLDNDLYESALNCTKWVLD